MSGVWRVGSRRDRSSVRALAWCARFAPIVAIAACSEATLQPVARGPVPAMPTAASRIECMASIRTNSVQCESGVNGASSNRTPGQLSPSGAANRDVILGNQSGFIKLTSSNVSSSGGVFSFDVTVQNKIAQSIGTSDGTTTDPNGIRVFFASGPLVTGGTGTMDFVNPGGGFFHDGTATFTATNQPFFKYVQRLDQGQVSAAKTWRLRFDATVTTFSFTLLVSAPVPHSTGYVIGNPFFLTLAAGETQSLGGTVLSAAGTALVGEPITYVSDLPAVAAVSAGGIVTAGATRGIASVVLQSGTRPGSYPTSVNVCPTIQTVVSGAVVAGSIAATDCYSSGALGGLPSALFNADVYRIALAAGQQLTASMTTGNSFVAVLDLINPVGTPEAVAGGLTASITSWTVQQTGVYRLETRTQAPGGTGAYSLSVSVASPGIAISTVTQSAVPVDLGAAAGTLDVALYAAGGSGTVDLFLAPAANCGVTTIAIGDSLLASQATPANLADPLTLAANTAALNTLNTPRFLNGSYCLKARLTTGVGTSTSTTVPLTLANASRYRGILSFTKTTALGTSPATSVGAGLTFDQGDLTVTVTPVDYGGTTTISTLSLTLAGAGKTLVLAPSAGTQTFVGVFGSASTTGAGSSISQYQTMSVGGDAITVTSATNAASQPVSFVPAVGIVRIDNRSPNALVLSNAGNGLPTANFANATYAFTSAVVGGKGADASGLTTTAQFGYRANDGSFVALAGSTATTDAACALAGWAIVADPSGIPNTPNAATPTQYRLRQFENDALGNIRCSDLPNPFGVDKELPQLTVVGPANLSVVESGTLMQTTILDAISGFTLGSSNSYTVMRNFSTSECVFGTTGNGCTVVGSWSIDIDNSIGTQAYYALAAKAVDMAGNASAPVIRTYLLDTTVPTVSGITVPQNITGGAATTFSTTLTDNVDLRSSTFSVLYSAATGINLHYSGDNFGPNYDATRVTNTTSFAQVPFFLKQLQATSALGDPIDLIASDSGEAQSVTIRAFDVANLSASSSAVIPNMNIASSSGFLGWQLTTFKETNSPLTLNNGVGAGTTSVTLVADVAFNSAAAQSAPAPFTVVCFYYQQTAIGAAADPTIPVGAYVQIGCVTAPVIFDIAGVSRTWNYQLGGFNPPSALGTSGSLNIIAIGATAQGVGLVSPVNPFITLAD